MRSYVEKALQMFTHPDPIRPQHVPHPWINPNYGARIQYAESEDTSPPLDKHGTKRLHEVIASFLSYVKAVDNTMLAALGTLATAKHAIERRQWTL
jgi:hypothetical protein